MEGPTEARVTGPVLPAKARAVAALARADLSVLGVGPKAEAALEGYVEKAHASLEARAEAWLQKFSFLPVEEVDVEALMKCPVEKAEELQATLEASWLKVWNQLPTAAQEHLDAPSFKTDHLKGELEAAIREVLLKREAPAGSIPAPLKRSRRERAAQAKPVESQGEGGVTEGPTQTVSVTVTEALNNGRSSNTVQCWVLTARGAVQAKKTARAKPSHLYQCQVHDGQTAAVVSGWGEAARALFEGLKNLEGQAVTISQCGASKRGDL